MKWEEMRNYLGYKPGQPTKGCLILTESLPEKPRVLALLGIQHEANLKHSGNL